MGTIKPGIIVLIVAVSGAFCVRAWGSEDVGAVESSGTRQAQFVVKVTADVHIVPLNVDLLESLLRSDAVLGKAARAVLGMGLDAPDGLFDVEPLVDAPVLEGPPKPVGENPAQSGPAGKERTVLFSLDVHLPDEVKPAAREFGNALIANLRTALEKTYAVYVAELRRQKDEAEKRRDQARRRFDETMRQSKPVEIDLIRLDPRDEALDKQLDQVVDLSRLSPQMPLYEAIEILRNSVQPPLNVVVLWRDLLENADIESSDPINMDGLPSVRLGTALENLIHATSNPFIAEMAYVVNHGVMTIGTVDGLPKKEMETRVHEVPSPIRATDQMPELVAAIQETIAPKSWSDLYPGLGEGTIAPSGDGRLVVWQNRDVHKKIREFLTTVGKTPSVALPVDAPQESLQERLQLLLSYRDKLEGEMDRLMELQHTREKDSAADAFDFIRNGLSAAANDLRVILADSTKTKGDDRTAAVIARSIAMMERCMQCCARSMPGRAPGYDVVSPWSDMDEVQALASRMAAKQRNLREVGRRISEIHRLLAGPRMVDGQFSHVQWAARTLDQASARVHEIECRLINSRSCVVTIMGGME